MTLKITAVANSIQFEGVLNRDTLILYSPFKLLNTLTGTIQFDFAALTAIDTAGLAWLLQQLAQARDTSLKIELCNVPQQLLSLADVSAVRALLPIVE
ncbi:STAS domain-containing protein [Rheinheimera sp. MMS21-TC3]|uniref:STAS domain-containing protein n=1 Tax=Rheinheimera sp. MMS21-TC3 TaxID=3072790 RepID=UPI0028C3DB39|nr:STAS domain-containing protein [Rheinheimera sp. MMS21-TC3]WNO62170.1 STAS domain-containing protein [Rheinheimera sp. MMS21-TC3]